MFKKLLKELISIWTKYLYIFQIFEYDKILFINQILKDSVQFTILKRQHYKDVLLFTTKVKLIFIVTLLLQILTMASVIIVITPAVFLNIALAVLILYLTPFYILISSFLLWPLEYSAKYFLVRKATQKVNSIKNLKIIGITGCYGKTSAMSFLSTLLQGDYNVFMPKSGYNTLLGIAQEINQKMPLNTEILLIELGDYQRGDIAAICGQFSPDIAVLTSIGSQHLERFKTMENLILAKAEIITGSKPEANIILPQYVYDLELIPKVSDKIYHISQSSITSFKNLKTYFTIDNDITKKEYHTSVLGHHIINDLSLAITCANLLSSTSLQAKLTLIKPVPRRMNPQLKGTILYIDDTYNIGVESAAAGVELLTFLKEQKAYTNYVVCTGGIVEQGQLGPEKNKQYGQLLQNSVDQIILFDTPFKQFIKDGISNSHKIIELVNYQEFYAKASTIIPANSVVLLQNEIPDQYYLS